jgi:hypothetical protein
MAFLKFTTYCLCTVYLLVGHVNFINSAPGQLQQSGKKATTAGLKKLDRNSKLTRNDFLKFYKEQF